MTFQNRSKSVGLIEIGSKSVRYMVATFDQAGAFRIDPRAKDSFVHDIDVDNPDETKVAKLWSKVEEFNEALAKIRCDQVLIYGTELCRRLEKRGQRPPSFVSVFSGEQEAVGAWAAGFMSAQYRSSGRYTIVDQGGGSTEIVSAMWTGRTIAGGHSHESLDDLGSAKMAALYARNSDKFSTFVRPLLEKYDAKIKLHEANGKTELVLLGTAATKLAFNIKHKRNDEDDYRPHDTDKTRLSIKEIADYYFKMDSIYKKDPERARYMLDRRAVTTNHYEEVMSGAIILMLISIRLGHQQVTVSVNSTRYGMGFLVALGLIR